MIKKITPIAIPAFAPDERPPLALLVFVAAGKFELEALDVGILDVPVLVAPAEFEDVIIPLEVVALLELGAPLIMRVVASQDPSSLIT